MVTAHRVLLALYAVLAAAVLLWDVIEAGRMLRNRRLPRSIYLTTAFGALLLAPALLVALSDASLVYGRAVEPVAWLWPAVTILFVLQALLALARGLANPILGVPILVYDAAIATVATARFLSSRGIEPPELALIMSAAQANALGMVGGRAALDSAMWLLVPMFAPALPSRSRVRVVARGVLAAGVAIAAALVLIEIPAAAAAIASYGRFASATLTERPNADLQFGLRVLPEMRQAPPPVAINADLDLADTLDVDAIALVVDPEAARGRPLDSLAHVLEAVRDDSTLVVVTLGYSRDARALFTRDSAAYLRDRLADVNRLTRALHPSIFLPADEPYGEGTRVLGVRTPEFWRAYLTRAAAVAHHVNPNIRVGVAAASYGSRDSALFAWAASRGSPLDIAGFSLVPGFDGATSLDTHMRIAQRWLQSPTRVRPAWVFTAGGYPIAHGEQSQRLALRGILAWATAQPAVLGVIVVQAGDYDTQMGLRAPTGQLRPAFAEVDHAIQAVRESAAQ